VTADEPEREAERYSFRQAHQAGAFHQAQLLTADAFGKEAKERDVGLSFGSTLREQLEELDHIGAIRPILFDAGESGVVFREEVEFAPWQTYEVTVWDDHKQVTAYYSHWQLLYARGAVELGRVPVSIEWFLDDEQRQTIGPRWRDWYSRQDEHRRGLDDSWRQRILLLVRLQGRYFPVIRGTLTKITSSLVYDPDAGDMGDPYRQTVRDFNASAVLDELGLTAEDTKEMYQRLALQGIMRDPLRYFHGLFRMAPYRERAKLKNEARRAQDAFDAAEMLRRFQYDLNGELLPLPDELVDASGGEWRVRLYGHKPRLRYDRHDLQIALRVAHLDPHIVHVIVEGESERDCFPQPDQSAHRVRPVEPRHQFLESRWDRAHSPLHPYPPHREESRPLPGSCRRPRGRRRARRSTLEG
jgi:hypothetical protein